MKITVLLFCIVMLASCSDRMDELQKLDVAPAISFSQFGELKQHITDSVRYSADSVFYYNLILEVSDDKKNLWKLNYKVNKGEAKVFYDGKELDGVSLRVDLPEVLLAVSPASKGMVDVEFTIQDRFENKQTATLNLYVFDNLIPVAVISGHKTSLNDPLEYAFDGGESYDQDKNFGGTVAGYAFEIEGRTITTTSKTINYIFPTQGTYTVTLKVIDNNGDYSKTAELQVNVN